MFTDQPLFTSNFLSRSAAEQLAAKYGTPLYVYDRASILRQTQIALAIPAPFGLTVRYAMKANPHPDVLRVLRQAGIKIDASSGFEADLALAAGFAPNDILLTSQQLAHNLAELGEQGVHFVACSLRQLEAFGTLFPGKRVSVRLNSGMGSGHSRKVNVGGTTSSFGIWHEYIADIKKLAARYHLTIERIHTHIGSGTDPRVWDRAVDTTLSLVEQFYDATIVDVGGGFKVGRLDGETSTDMVQVGNILRQKLLEFAQRTGRKLHLEIEPGTFMVANAGELLAQVDDIVDTGRQGYKFVKLNTGMTELLRPSLYAAQHPIAILGDNPDYDNYVVVGHCCESGDLLTPDPADPEKLSTRFLRKPRIGDLVLVGGCGAYAASMAAHGYNSFPRAREVMV